MPRVTPNSPIGIFDSGPGGLAVLREIRRLLPHEDILYLFLVTGENSREFAAFAARFLDMPDIAVTRLPLPEIQQGAEYPTPEHTGPT